MGLESLRISHVIFCIKPRLVKEFYRIAGLVDGVQVCCC